MAINLTSKNTIQALNKFPKNNIALFLFGAMLLGLLCSRSIASISMFLFAVNALRDVHPRRWLQERWFLFGLIWVGFYGISGLWSADKHEWFTHFQTKFPFLFLPLAFSFLEPWTPKQLRWFTLIFMGFMIAGACYSLSFLVGSPEMYITGYKFSHTIPTPAYNDHIAFSTCVALCIAWAAFSWPYWGRTSSKVIIAVATFLLIIYLHILAAKSGLVAFYLFAICFIIHLLFLNWKRGVFALLGIIAVASCAITFIPTLKERVNYTRYSYEQYQQGERTGNYSDAGRIHSYHIALKVIKEKPLLGAGAGDVMTAMGEKYRIDYPQMAKEQYLFPHNQFLGIAVSVGIPALLAFICWILAPFLALRRNRESFFFGTVWLMLLIPLLVDPFLEVQAGVFVYLFFLLMQRSLLNLRP